MTSLKFIDFGSPDKEVLADLNKWLMENTATPEATKFKWILHETPESNAFRNLQELSIEKLIEMTQGVIDILERDGWTQNRYYGPDNTVCILGAANRFVGAPVGSSNILNSEVHVWAHAICEFFGWGNVPSFNDHYATTFEKVIEKLREFMYDLKGR